MEKLKSCPFCEGEAIDQWHPKSQPNTEKDVTHAIWCQHCGASTEIKITKKQAIQAWNTRPESSLKLPEKKEVKTYPCSSTEFLQQEREKAEQFNQAIDLIAKMNPSYKPCLDVKKCIKWINNILMYEDNLQYGSIKTLEDLKNTISNAKFSKPILDVEKVKKIIIETWKAYYQVAEGYEMHETEIECCEQLAEAMMEERER